jgi:Cation/multidrug efflux pump
MYLLGYSLDNLSLMGLTIAVGFVVDDAIVMIENIVRYLEEGMRPLEAAIKGAGQIGFTIISITFSLIAVFIPLLFMGGIVGRLFHEFAVTVTIAVLVSAFVSLTLTPVMCSLFLQRDSEQKANRLSRGAEHVFEAILAGYDRSLSWVLSHQPLMLLVTLGLIALTGYLYVIIPKGFFPQQDTGFIFAQAEAREDISFAAMSAIQHRLASIVERDPAVQGWWPSPGPRAAMPPRTRRACSSAETLRSAQVSADQVIQRLRAKTAVVPGVRFYMQAGQDINVGGRLARTQYQYTLTDTNTEELNHWAPIIEHAMAKLPELQDVASDQQVAAPHLSVDIDRDMAYRMGLSLSLIDQTLYDAFGQRQIATIYSSTNQYKVILEVAPDFQADPSALSGLFIRGPTGAQVPLSAVAHFTPKVEPLSVNHEGQFPAVTLSFNLTPGWRWARRWRRSRRWRPR